jgi:maltose O-acetyltransferase
MSAFEDSQKGLPHVFDETMHGYYLNAAHLTDLYNRTGADDWKEQKKLLKKLGVHTGKGVRLMPSFRCEFGFNIHIGDRTFINYNSVILDNSPVTI